ncbi:hypothetical protein JYU34_018028 [Plutella xylostella]|uniref:Uncharacterized protein n=1 Tax=Plutella xylostella TaxID=51655 RepID=A0ABQ7PZJ2_PLUXY|nr:hypothetical protein JYU34_018028 [Plutella xylostella]
MHFLTVTLHTQPTIGASGVSRASGAAHTARSGTTPAWRSARSTPSSYLSAQYALQRERSQQSQRRGAHGPQRHHAGVAQRPQHPEFLS